MLAFTATETIYRIVRVLSAQCSLFAAIATSNCLHGFWVSMLGAFAMPFS